MPKTSDSEAMLPSQQHSHLPLEWPALTMIVTMWLDSSEGSDVTRAFIWNCDLVDMRYLKVEAQTGWLT